MLKRFVRITGFAVSIGVIVIIGYRLNFGQAAVNTGSLEPELGNVQGASKIVDSATASGGKAIQFPTKTTILDLTDPHKKDIAMQLVSSAENSSLNWRAQYAYIEYNVEGNATENRGYTGGIIGFTSKTHDMLELVQYYKQIAPGNILEKYIPALINVDGTSSQSGLGANYERDWRSAAASDPKFAQAQDRERDRVYFNPAVNMAKSDGLQSLGQFIYYDAAVMHGPDAWGGGLPDIRADALAKAKPPTQGGTEKAWLQAFLDARKAEMLREEAHSDTSRVDTMQRKFLNENNLTLTPPLNWSTYGDPYTIAN